VKFVTCFSLQRAGLWDTRNCCSTCHHDDEDDYVQLGDYDLPDGRVAYLCCAARLALGDDLETGRLVPPLEEDGVS
jgi:hypothetical protein